MSQSQHSDASALQQNRERPTALGSRENFWGEETKQQDQRGHSETCGTNASEYIARQLILQYVEPICTTTIDETPDRGLEPLFAWLFESESVESNSDAMHKENRVVELTEPTLHIPKQHDTGSRIIENRQHRLRRRYNPETGYINWGETTSTGIPQFGWEVFEQCVHDYLQKRLRNGQDSDEGDSGLTITSIDDYLEHANRLWHDPGLDSQKSLEKFVAFVRDEESPDDGAVSN